MKAADARVLLTGASGGLGRAMAAELTRAGARGRRTGARGGLGRALAAELTRAGARVMGVGRGPGQPDQPWTRADLTTPEGIAAVARAAAAWRPNVVVHAAGLPGFGALGALPPERIAAVLQANLLAPMLLTQALLPQLLALPRAQLVFVGSALGRIGLPGFSVYGASKAGLHGFAEALRRELADTPVKVQILGPRSTRTGFNGDAVEAYNRATGTSMDTPETVALALLDLIESEAAERFVGFPERFAVRLNGVLGARLDGSFVRHRRHLTVPEGVSP